MGVPAFDIPPLEETQVRVEQRWAATTELRAAVCTEIDRRAEEWRGLLADLVRIPSVNLSTEGERTLADLVARLMRELRSP